MNSLFHYNISDRAVTSAIVARLYVRAARLERAWSAADLADDFGSRMVLATVRHLERVGTRRLDGTRRSGEQQARFAEALLAHFWTRNARRDFARRTAAFAAGRAITVVAADTVPEAAAVIRTPAVPTDDFGGETGRAAVRALVAAGWARERAWALVLFCATGEDYEATCALLASRFEARVANATLRQWKRRYFGAGLALLASLRDELGLA